MGYNRQCCQFFREELPNVRIGGALAAFNTAHGALSCFPCLRHTFRQGLNVIKQSFEKISFCTNLFFYFLVSSDYLVYYWILKLSSNICLSTHHIDNFLKKKKEESFLPGMRRWGWWCLRLKPVIPTQKNPTRISRKLWTKLFQMWSHPPPSWLGGCWFVS